MKKLVSLSVAAAFLASAAAAGTQIEVAPERPVYTPPPAPAAVNWSGAYLGAQIGYGTNNYDGFPSQSAIIGSVYGGYRHDSGSHTWGVEAEFSPGVLFGTFNTPWGDQLQYGAGVYVTAGLPVTDDRRTLLNFAAGPSLMIYDDAGTTGTSLGLMMTAGVEHMVTDSVILRGALRYGYAPSLGSADVTTNSYGIGAGVAFRF